MPIPLSLKLITFMQNSTANDCDCYSTATSPKILANTYPFHLSPTTAYLELTPACNNRCLGCSNVFLTDKPTRHIEIAQAPLNIAQWRTILSKLAPQIDHVSITGGEPTLYKHFAAFTNLLAEFNLSFTLFTNARWYNPAHVIQALSQTNHLRGLLISLHGQDALTHEAGQTHRLC